MNIEEDVNQLIFYLYDCPENKHLEVSSILTETIKSHGLKNIIDNLSSRNPTRIITDLLSILTLIDQVKGFK